jgi:oligoendopeptidase F
MNSDVLTTVRKKRHFVAEDFVPASWSVIEPYFANLLSREINSVEELKQWLLDSSELEAVLQEDSRLIYVRTTVDTTDERAKADLVNLYTSIYPQLSVHENLVKKKFIASKYVDDLNQDEFYTTIRRTKKELDLYREENVPLLTELNLKKKGFDEISGAQSIVYNGSELTMQQAGVFLKSADRNQRQDIFAKLCECRLKDTNALDDLLTELITLRNKVAINSGYKNYIDYAFDELARFDYTPADCVNFHATIEKIVMPLVNECCELRKKNLGLEVLRPWDMDVDITGKEGLAPFKSTDELIEKTITCFNRLDPYFGECIQIMRSMNFLDLDSRLHKGPGGYNMTLPEIGIPFIFMNSANSEHDLITIVHEGGHAVHSFLAHNLELTSFKETSSEISEVASMGMELMTMEHWDIFYSDKSELLRAKRNHLQYILSLLTKTCIGDAFQFWLYSNPNHTVQERRNKWKELHMRFSPKGIDWSGYEEVLETGYQKILHFYIVPFYYIEYAFAQLGALALWKNFKKDSVQTIENYKKALSLGFTKPIPVFYETFGGKFDFSEIYISGIIEFLKKELKAL